MATRNPQSINRDLRVQKMLKSWQVRRRDYNKVVRRLERLGGGRRRRVA